MVQRAWNHRGSSYQTVRMQFPKMSDFIWPFKSAHPVNVKFNREWWVNGGIVWSGFGTNAGWGYVNLTASPQNQYTMGFGYGPLASSWYDTSSSTSYFHRNGSIINPTRRSTSAPSCAPRILPSAPSVTAVWPPKPRSLGV